MKNILSFILILFFLGSCTDGFNSDDDPSDVPPVKSYTTYISQNSVTLNGFIDNSYNEYQGSDTYKVGFVFRTDRNDTSNQSCG